MQATYLSHGESIDHTPGSAVEAGDVVVLGDIVTIAKLDIASGELGALSTEGLYEVVKDSSNMSTTGAAVYWDADGNPVGGEAGTGAFTLTADGNKFAGYNTTTAGASVGTVQILLKSASRGPQGEQGEQGEPGGG